MRLNDDQAARLIALPSAVLVELAFALKLYQRWPDLKTAGLAGAYQAAGALLIGWPTVVFALAATWAAMRSAEASESQSEAADQQAVAAHAQALSATMGIRPVLMPSFGFKDETMLLELVNAGSGITTQIFWARATAIR